jgi:uncharacterized protein (DUF362 family)
LVSKVAVVDLGGDAEASFKRALKLIGNIDDLNTSKKSVVVKVGVFAPQAGHHTTLDVTRAIVKSFNKAPKIWLAESDNYRGTATERLQIWKELFNERVAPFNLSEDKDTRKVKIAGEEMSLSHILFKPNVFVSTHVLRSYDKGSVLKNLFGLTPGRKKARFHKKLEAVLLDAYEAIGGIDLAVLDGTYWHQSVAPALAHKKVKTNILVVGRDAVAVEAVGYALVGLKTEKVPVIKEAVKRGLGEGDISKIEVLGSSLDDLKERFKQKTV